MALWWEDGGISAQLGELLEAAREAGLATWLLAAWACVLRRDPDHTLGASHVCLAGSLSRAEARALARHLEDVLQYGNPARFTLEVFAPRVYARWALGRWPGPAAARRPTRKKPRYTAHAGRCTSGSRTSFHEPGASRAS